MDPTKKRCSRVTRAQKDCLINFMSENREFARGQFNGVNSYQKSLEMWKLLTLQLNSMGPIVKSSEQWKKCWTDLKSGVRKLKNSRKVFINKTGGGTIAEAPRDLNDMEEVIVSIISTHAVDGDSVTPEAGIAGNSSVHNFGTEEKENSEDEMKQRTCSSKVRKVENSSYQSALSEAKQMQEEFDAKFEKLEAQNSKMLKLTQEIFGQNETIAAQNEQIMVQNISNAALLNLVISQNKEILNLFKND